MSSLPDEIRKALEKPDGVSEETMAPLASRYDEEARPINERLDEAVALLRKNLRSEAIQSANRRPNVMEAAASLDFPELNEWREILQFLGVPVPQLLDQDKVQQLNEAIVETQPIEELLKQHRKLAIARAPLSWRLKVLRRIAKVDAMNPIWMEDVENYEAARRKTLANEVDTAIKQNNATAIASLHNELSQANWVTPPPAELRQSLETALATNDYDHRIEGMRGIAAELHNAFSEFNEPSARNFWGQWSQACNEFNAPIPTDLADEVAPAQTWLSELDAIAATSQQRSQALRDLRQTMHHSRELASLRRAYANASRFDEPIPPELEQRFHALIHEIELGRKRSTQMKIVSVVMSAVLIGGIVAFWQYRRMKQQRVDNAVQQFSQLVNGDQINEASSFWNGLKTDSPELTQDLEMLALHSKLERKIAAEDERVAQFNSYLEKADDENPANINVGALNEAEKLAQTETEKSLIFDLQLRLDDYQRQRAEEQSKLALQELEKINAKLEQIKDLPIDEVDTKELSNLIAALDNLPRSYPRRDSRVDAQVKIALTKAKNYQDSANEYWMLERKRDAAFRRVLAARDLQTYGTALANYAQNARVPQLEQECERALDERSSWELGMKSNELPIALSKALNGGVSYQESQLLKTQLATLAGQSGENRLLTEFQNLTQVVLSDSGDPSDAMITLKEDLSRRPLSDLVTVVARTTNAQDSDPKRYFVYNDDYLRAEQRLKLEAVMPLQHVADADGGIASSTIQGPNIRAHVEPGRSTMWLTDELDNRSADFDREWGATFLKLAAETRDRSDLDGLIKEELIYQLLKACSDGSGIMASSLADALRVLASRAEARQQWYQPSTPSDKLAPIVESQVIPTLKSAYSNINKQQTSIAPAANLRYRWVGFLSRDSGGKLSGRITVQPAEPGPIYIMCPGSSNPSQVDILSVGDWDGNELQLRTTSSELNAGRPLFVLENGN